ncbi:MAG: hypothetical protein AAFY88_24745 [Acidobacteriota bacterium]
MSDAESAAAEIESGQGDHGAYLRWHLARLAGQLSAHVGAASEPVGPAPAPLPGDPIELVVAAFGLSPFERDLLLLCAGVELVDAVGAGHQ